MVVPPLWPNYDTVNDATWTGYTQPSGAVTVPDSVPFLGTMHAVTEVGHDAFYRCNQVTSVTLPEAVTAIGEWAFGKCHGLTSFTLPASVTAIDRYAFARCYGLTSVTIGNSVTSIEKRAFYGCKLRNVLIKCATPPEIDDETFSNQTLYHTTLYVPAGCWDAYAYDDSWYQFINISIFRCFIILTATNRKSF